MIYNRFRLEDFIIDENENIYFAHWKLHRNRSILIVVDHEKTMTGVVTFREFRQTYIDDGSRMIKIREICNQNCKCIRHHKDKEGDLLEARSIFIDYAHVNHIPVVDERKHPIGIITKQDAFWKRYYEKGDLPRMHYAYCIYNAALEASLLGYKKFSVIEFGVAGGNGLLNCEFHVEQIERLFGMEIEIYGFDSGEGLPLNNMGYKDMVYYWPGGSYKMDREKLEKRLTRSKLVLGRLENTLQTFFDVYEPAVVGCMLVDVDYYSSALPVLDFLKNDNRFFMPRVMMYWDDTIPDHEFQGEYLAISEFNRDNDLLKISPEKPFFQGYMERIKICHRFSHELYNKKALMMGGRTVDDSELELPLEVQV